MAEATIGEKALGTTIKTAVKAVIAVTNIENVKKKIINKLDRIDEGRFKAQYTSFYEIIKDLPPDIKATYEVTPYMTKAQMARNIKSVDKKEIYEIINRIPDKTVADLFKQYLREMGKRKN